MEENLQESVVIVATKEPMVTYECYRSYLEYWENGVMLQRTLANRKMFIPYSNVSYVDYLSL